jgi:hypothetical protein
VIDLTIVATAEHQTQCGLAVADGIRAVGGTARLQRTDACSTLHVCTWGWRQGKRLRDAGHEVLVMERAYLGDRFAWYSLGWNGLNGRARFPEWPTDGGARFREHFGHLMRPWRRDGGYVLLVGQVPGDASLQGRDLSRWYSEAALRAQSAYEAEVLFRPHPAAVKRGIIHRPEYTRPSTGNLCAALDGALACITFNSNTGVEAVLAGVPTVAVDAGAMAWDVAAHRVGDFQRPAREAWAHRLAWRQWRLEEIATGKPFEGLHA